MIQLVYVSSATEPFTAQQLVELLKKARDKNASQGITGMLLYKDGNFMQVLEGEEDQVRPLYQTICADPRHHGEIVLLEEPITERQFSEWSMAFRDLNSAEVRSMPGYSPYLNRALSAESFSNDPTGCMGLLQLFRDSR